MGWSYCGKNQTTGDEMGYSVQGTCAKDGCGAAIDHGLSYVCGGMHEGGTHGCGRYFCSVHLAYYPVDANDDNEQLCAECWKMIQDERGR